MAKRLFSGLLLGAFSGSVSATTGMGSAGYVWLLVLVPVIGLVLLVATIRFLRRVRDDSMPGRHTHHQAKSSNKQEDKSHDN